MRINGWCGPTSLSHRSKLSNKLSDLQIDDSKIKPIKITSVAQFIKAISEFDNSLDNPVFYRGQIDANYFDIPTVFRNRICREHILVNEFLTRFPNESRDKSNSFERLALMQHYGLRTRMIDITESPLASLYFACKPYIKFQKINSDDHKKNWGVVFPYRAPKEAHPKDVNNVEYEIKHFGSNTTNILANTAFCENHFEYGRLDMFCLKDLRADVIKDFTFFSDIISRSVIVRSPLNNLRIKNQRGAFILCSCNRAVALPKGSRISPNAFTQSVIDGTAPRNLISIVEDNIPGYGDRSRWGFAFEKVMPYSLDDPIHKFREDPFDIERPRYRDKDGKKIVFFIPPKAKDEILNQLKLLNITDGFIYPEMDTGANEINEIFG
jgi:hypothetical protein